MAVCFGLYLPRKDLVRTVDSKYDEILLRINTKSCMGRPIVHFYSAPMNSVDHKRRPDDAWHYVRRWRGKVDESLCLVSTCPEFERRGESPNTVLPQQLS